MSSINPYIYFYAIAAIVTVGLSLLYSLYDMVLHPPKFIEILFIGSIYLTLTMRKAKIPMQTFGESIVLLTLMLASALGALLVMVASFGNTICTARGFSIYIDSLFYFGTSMFFVGVHSGLLMISGVLGRTKQTHALYAIIAQAIAIVALFANIYFCDKNDTLAVYMNSIYLFVASLAVYASICLAHAQLQSYISLTILFLLAIVMSNSVGIDRICINGLLYFIYLSTVHVLLRTTCRALTFGWRHEICS